MKQVHVTFRVEYAEEASVSVDSFETGNHGPVTVLFGASGSGKSTFLKVLAGLVHPTSGVVKVGGETWHRGNWGLPARARNVGYVPQNYHLFPHLSVAGNTAYGLKGVRRSERQKRVEETLERLEIPDLADRLPAELSGGQQQRAAIARALAPGPQLLLLDEPLSALDPAMRERMQWELRQVLEELACPTFLVTHSREEALLLGDGCAVMDGGTMIQQGPVEDVFSHPTGHGSATALSVENILPAKVEAEMDGLVRFRVGDAQLAAVSSPLAHGARNVLACIRAEDIMLSESTLSRGSARNQLSGVVTHIIATGPVTRVTIDCGFPLTALLTKASAEELSIAPGSFLTALIKATSIHLIPRS